MTSLLEAVASWWLLEARGWSCLVLAVMCGEVDSVTPLMQELVPEVSNSNNCRARDPARTALVMLRAEEGG